MKITEHINKAEQTLFSFEILPPRKGENINQLFAAIDPLMEFNPPFIDVTYHREEYFYKKQDDGSLRRHTVRKRPGTVGICAALINHYKVDAVPHLICGGFNKEVTENALIDLDYLGIDNVLVVRGDPMKGEKYFKPNSEGYAYAIDLLKQVVDMNYGRYLHEDLLDTTSTDFCIGVAGYPEKHFESPNLKSDLKFLKDKVKAGADYIVTQMFYDNQKYFDFVKSIREKGIDVPVIPGIKPISIKKHLSILPQNFYIDLPESLVNEVLKCKDNKQVREVGVEWAIAQCKELIEFGVPVMHFYSMGKTDNVYKIAKELF
jgi:methylenetetrahydrofolate reductase (NADPH)